jgi:site-specific DNA recombinase
MKDIKDPKELMAVLMAGMSGSKESVDALDLRYAIYARKSTTSEDRQASSIEDQIRDCMERIVTPNNLNVVRIYQESYSAKIADTREQFNSLINAIENGKINGLIAWHPDRLARNMKEAGAIIDLVDRGLIADLQFPTFTFENTPAGKMLLGITFVMAKQYSEHLAESVDRGNKRAVEDGEFIGKFKHGYVINSRRQFEPDPRNFTKIKHVFAMALDGKSQKQIREWINTQGYTVQKRPGGIYEPHSWSKDDVSKLLRDSHYTGIHKWGKTFTYLNDHYDFEPILSVEEFLKINKIDSLDSSKVLTLHSPRPEARSNLMRGMVYCGKCDKSMTSMIIDKKDKDSGDIIASRYYYKCETEDCVMFGKSIRPKYLLELASAFFGKYLFITQSNYDYILNSAKNALESESEGLTRSIARLKKEIANKQASYEKVKQFVVQDPSLKGHYNLDEYAQEVQRKKAEYENTLSKKSNLKSSLPTFEEYLKLLGSTPEILTKMHDMKAMDMLLRFFFSNFTVNPINDSTFKGSTIEYKLKEPWEGFLKNNDFVLGAASLTHFKRLP